MIEELLIENLVLVTKAEIAFGPGLNILTGETGAGKSAVLAAIRLLLGERADSELIRRGADRAIVEAKIRGEETWLVRRELYASGKSRAFVDGGQVSLQELKTLLGKTVELVDQSSSNLLKESEEQRRLLDAFANVGIETMKEAFEAEKTGKAKLEELLQMQNVGGSKAAEEDLARLEEVNWQEGEEETLTQEHHLLTHAQEILEKIGAVTEALTESSEPMVSSLKRFSHLLESLHPSADALKNAALELEEASRSLLTFTDTLEINPRKLAAVEERLGQIESLKRRFGSNWSAVEQTKVSLKEKVDQLSNLKTDIEAAQKGLAALFQRALRLSEELTQKRTRAIAPFEKAILSELRHLNLPHASFSIGLRPKPLSSNGADTIEFLFSANPGQAPMPIDQCASGGELSRLLFAIKTTLASKEQSTCLIFDEIDSNVGGKTAALLGEKLQHLAISRQLICITHFLQVAKCAMDHFLVSKETEAGQALTRIAKLKGAARDREFARMMGGGNH
ncbi:MAG TPA: DNA repair protein RecN [Chlamydiales bacterium]